MSKVPKFSWIQETLRRHAPGADLSKGFDINNNGFLEEEEKLRDVNNNGILGDSEDWQDFLRRNPKLLESSSPVNFFNLGAAFARTNPIHDRLTVEAEMLPAEEIEKAYDDLEDILNDVKSALAEDKKEREPKEKLKLVYQVMKKRGISFKSQLEDSLFSSNMAKKVLDCDTSGDVILAIAHEMGWPVFLVYLPGHIIVRWDDGETSFNMEFGKDYSDKYYHDRFSLGPSTVQNGVYWKKLDRDEMDGLYLEARATAKSTLQNYRGAIEDYDRAMELYPKFVLAHNNSGIAKFALGDYQGAIKAFNKALALDRKLSEGYDGRGCVENRLQDYEAAKWDFDRAIELKPSNAWAWLHRGTARIYLRDPKGAANDLRQAAKDPLVKAEAEKELRKLTSE